MIRHFLLAAGAALFLFGGCVPRILKPISVFESDLDFHPDAQDPSVLIYQNPDFKVTSYSKFLIDPVKIYSNESGRSVSPREEALLAETFRQELIKVLESGYPIVDNAGPGVLRIRAAIQDIQPAHMELDENEFLVIRLDTLLARVAMELECVDSLSGERVAALIHPLKEREYAEKDKTARLLNIRSAFSEWTKSLRKRFDEAKARPKQGFGNSDIEEQKRLRFEEGE